MANDGKVGPQACGIFFARERGMAILVVEPSGFIGRIVDERSPRASTQNAATESRECSHSVAVFALIIVSLMVLAAGFTLGLSAIVDLL